MIGLEISGFAERDRSFRAAAAFGRMERADFDCVGERTSEKVSLSERSSLLFNASNS